MSLSRYFTATLNSNKAVAITDATAFLTAANITDTTQRYAITNLVDALKSNGIWDKILAIYPMVGGTEFTHKFNLKSAIDSDASFRLSFFNTPTHNALGVSWNDNSYAKPFVSYPSGDMSFGYWVATPSTSANDVVMGTYADGIESYLQSKNTGGQQVFISGTDNRYIIAGQATHGFAQGSTLAGNATMSLNDVILGTRDSTTNNIVQEVYIGAMNNQGNPSNYTNATCGFASIGAGLTETEMLTYNTIVQNYQAVLGRQ